MTTDKKRKPVIFDMRNGSYTIGEMLDDACEFWGEGVCPDEIAVETFDIGDDLIGNGYPGQIVVLSHIEHMANYVPHRNAAETKAHIDDLKRNGLWDGDVEDMA